MTAARPLFAAWLVLLALLAGEVAAARLLHAGLLTPLFGVAMAALVAARLMRADDGPAPIRLFVCYGLFWLAVLLALGMMDPLTRTDVKNGVAVPPVLEHDPDGPHPPSPSSGHP